MNASAGGAGSSTPPPPAPAAASEPERVPEEPSPSRRRRRPEGRREREGRKSESEALASATAAADGIPDPTAAPGLPLPPVPRRPSSDDPPRSAVILRRIASYLSLGDAEGVCAASAPSSFSRPSPSSSSSDHLSRTSRRSHASNGGRDSSLLPGYHSLDHRIYHSLSRNTPPLSSIVDSDERDEAEEGGAGGGEPSRPPDADGDSNGDEDEGWFVGGGPQRTPAGMALSPLEEEFYGPLERRPPPEEAGGPLERLLEIDRRPAPAPEEREEGEGQRTGQPTGEGGGADPRPSRTSALADSPDSPGCDCTVVSSDDDGEGEDEDDSFLVRRERRIRRRAIQRKLASAVFAHPYPLREYCLDAYETAATLRRDRRADEGASETAAAISPSTELHGPEPSPETERGVAAMIRSRRLRKYRRKQLLRALASRLLESVPLSVLLDLTEAAFDLSVDTLVAVARVGGRGIRSLLAILSDVTFHVLDALTSVNPFHLFHFILGIQKKAMGKTGDVLVSGIQSVATGVGSVSGAALERLSKQGLAFAGGVVGSSRNGVQGGGMGGGGYGGMRGGKDRVGGGGYGGYCANPLESKLFRRLHRMESVSRLIAYSERNGEEAFGRTAKKRAQRMMHYNVSFQPFTATIQPRSPTKVRLVLSFDQSLGLHGSDRAGAGTGDDDSLSSESLHSSGSAFMRTPTSFPPTPDSRMYYFERGSRHTENVVFLARDQLRVERGLGCPDARTRAMSRALREGSRLAVFDAADRGGSCAAGVALSCGQHIATKVGNAPYCGARSMIPAMRNSYVYFEISVSPPNGPSQGEGDAGVALSVGLSTSDMPLNALVGAWKGSVGLCSTGQILNAGRWLAGGGIGEGASYGSDSTVGCLLYIDDKSSFEGWDEANVAADVTFNVDRRVVPAVEGTAPGAGLAEGGRSRASSAASVTTKSSQLDESVVDPTLSIVVPRNHELYPTVTLHGPATCVMCRFSAEDTLACSRREIGAPRGVTVYSVDGSIILDEYAEFVDEGGVFLAGTATPIRGLPHEEVAL